MWLLRGLKFTARGLRHNIDNPTAELSTSFTHGYEESLKKHHGMMVRPVFYVSFRLGFVTARRQGLPNGTYT